MIEKLSTKNAKACAELAHQLWPDADVAEHAADLMAMIDDKKFTCFLYKSEDGTYAGFIEMSLRKDYVEGMTSSPVAYVEGIYVVESKRKTGVARALLAAGEQWGRERGCSEIASDAEIGNEQSIAFHKQIGFIEMNRVVCFIKDINS
ncbi:MAG: GNAT family N-acetyltransferase [Lewinella sp.]|nr:GNAT family N-acetyltransferase [Lewinella sp.]